MSAGAAIKQRRRQQNEPSAGANDDGDIAFQDFVSDEEHDADASDGDEASGMGVGGTEYEPIEGVDVKMEDVVQSGYMLSGCPTQPIDCLELSAQKGGLSLAVAGSRDGCAYVWDVHGDGGVLHKLDCKALPDDQGKVVRFRGRGSSTSAGERSPPRNHGMRQRNSKHINRSRSCRITAAGIDWTSSSILSATSRGGVWLWDIETGSVLRCFPDAHQGKVSHLLLGSNGHRGSHNPFGERTFLTASSDRTIRVWDPRARTPLIQTLKGHTDRVTAISTLAGSGCVISGSADRSVRVWNARTGRQNLVLQDHFGAVSCLSSTPHDQSLARGRTGDFYDSSASSPNAGREMGFLSGANDGTIKFWSGYGHNVQGEKESKSKVLRTLRGHKGTVSAIVGCSSTFPSSSTLGRVISVGSDASLRLWDYSRGRCIGTFIDSDEAALHRMARKSGYKGTLLASALWPHANYVITGGLDGSIKVWDVSPTLVHDSPMRSKNLRARAIGHASKGGNVHKIKAHPGSSVSCMKMVGDMLVSAAKDGSVKCECKYGSCALIELRIYITTPYIFF